MELETEYKEKRDAILERLKPLLEENEKMGPFCTDPNAVISLHIAPENYHHLNHRQYPIPHALIPHLQQTIDKWEREHKITRAPPMCRFNSPLLVAPKHDKDGKISGLRICIDARNINDYLMELDNFELPRIGDILQNFNGCMIFGELDLSEAYFQFPLHPDTQPYTAFTFKGQQYMFVSCPYGLKPIPQFFQRYMATLLHDFDFVFPYIDNLPIASRSWEEHERHCRMIIERLNSVGLRIKPASINIGNAEIRILGHLISNMVSTSTPRRRK